jgi:hypothetical protein
VYLSNARLIGSADAAGHRDLAIHHAERAWAGREPQFILFARYFLNGARSAPIPVFRRSSARWTRRSKTRNRLSIATVLTVPA